MDIAIEKKKGFKKKHIPYVLGALLLAFVVWLIASDHSSTLKVDSRSRSGRPRKARSRTIFASTRKYSR